MAKKHSKKYLDKGGWTHYIEVVYRLACHKDDRKMHDASIVFTDYDAADKALEAFAARQNMEEIKK